MVGTANGVGVPRCWSTAGRTLESLLDHQHTLEVHANAFSLLLESS